MVHTLELATLVFVFGCKNNPSQQVASGSAVLGSAAPTTRPVTATPTWTFESKPVELRCGGDPLALPDAVASTGAQVGVTLASRASIPVCHDRASVAETCACLAASVPSWAKDLSLAPKVTCDPKPTEIDAGAQIVRLESEPVDLKATTGGEARVLIAKRGATWSAISVIGSAPDIDRTETPNASEIITIDRTQAEPIDGGTLYWIETRDASEDKGGGELDESGDVTGTICEIRTETATCKQAVTLATWAYTFTPTKGTCAIRTAVTLVATVSATGVTTKLTHGKEDKPLVGSYRN